MTDLKGKTLFITGATRGIGYAIAERAAKDGANIAIIAKTTEPQPTLPGTIFTAAEDLIKAGGNAIGIKTDIRFEDQVLADSCEALIGSIYLDKGYAMVEKLILDLWSKHIKNSVITQIDAKTKLQELSLKKFKKLPLYKIISNTGPRHKPLFKVGVKLINTNFYISEGKSKKDAEQNAAFKCLQDFKTQ